MSGTQLSVRGPAGVLWALDSGEQGGATPALFIHGVNMSSAVWGPMVERMSSDRRCVTFDLRGHGRSDRRGPFGPEDYAADALAVLDHVGLERIHVIGTSFGGAAATALAAAAPDRVRSIVAIGSTLKPEGIDIDAALETVREAGVEAFFAQAVPVISFRPGADPALVNEAVAAASTDRDFDTVGAVVRGAFSTDLLAVADAVRVPALVLTGEVDLTCPVAQGRAMADALRATFTVLPGEAHMAVVEDPDTVVGEVNRFLKAND